MQVKSAVAVVRQEVGEQQITPAAAIVQWSDWINGFDVGPSAWDKHGVTDEDQPVRGGRLAANRLAPDANVGHLNVVQSPACNGNRSGDASGVVQRSIKTSEGRTRCGAHHIDLNLLLRVSRARCGYGHRSACTRHSRDLKCSITAP